MYLTAHGFFSAFTDQRKRLLLENPRSTHYCLMMCVRTASDAADHGDRGAFTQWMGWAEEIWGFVRPAKPATRAAQVVSDGCPRAFYPPDLLAERMDAAVGDMFVIHGAGSVAFGDFSLLLRVLLRAKDDLRHEHSVISLSNLVANAAAKRLVPDNSGDSTPSAGTQLEEREGDASGVEDTARPPPCRLFPLFAQALQLCLDMIGDAHRPFTAASTAQRAATLRILRTLIAFAKYRVGSVAESLQWIRSHDLAAEPLGALLAFRCALLEAKHNPHNAETLSALRAQLGSFLGLPEVTAEDACGAIAELMKASDPSAEEAPEDLAKMASESLGWLLKTRGAAPLWRSAVPLLEVHLIRMLLRRESVINVLDGGAAVDQAIVRMSRILSAPTEMPLYDDYLKTMCFSAWEAAQWLDEAVVRRDVSEKRLSSAEDVRRLVYAAKLLSATGSSLTTISHRSPAPQDCGESTYGSIPQHTDIQG